MLPAGKHPGLPRAQLRKGCCFLAGLGIPACSRRSMAHSASLAKALCIPACSMHQHCSRSGHCH
eukprot:9953294-Lingulodinium_polyedra.AAC.1